MRSLIRWVTGSVAWNGSVKGLLPLRVTSGSEPPAATIRLVDDDCIGIVHDRFAAAGPGRSFPTIGGVPVHGVIPGGCRSRQPVASPLGRRRVSGACAPGRGVQQETYRLDRVSPGKVGATIRVARRPRPEDAWSTPLDCSLPGSHRSSSIPSPGRSRCASPASPWIDPGYFPFSATRPGDCGCPSSCPDPGAAGLRRILSAPGVRPGQAGAGVWMAAGGRDENWAAGGGVRSVTPGACGADAIDGLGPEGVMGTRRPHQGRPACRA